MSDEKKGEELQFGRAEYEHAEKAASSCASCGGALGGAYYQVNGQVTCERCKTDLEMAKTTGGGAGGFLRATVFGVGAGAIGTALWYAVRVATGWEVGLIAVVVGVMVGAAVRKGAGGRGGWVYQALAVFLTYMSIVCNYVPDILSALKESELTGIARATSVAVYVVAAPFLGGFDNIIGIFIIGIGLYEAWKLSRNVPLEITGPHRVGATAPPALPPGA